MGVRRAGAEGRMICRVHWDRYRRNGTYERVKQSNQGLTCRARGCFHAAQVKGLCQTCYVRAKTRGGDPDARGSKAAHADDLWTRLWRRTVVVGECWTFTGAATGKDGAQGYRGLQWAGKWKSAHRTAYIAYVSADVVGLDIHHLCGTKSCWRPEHLQALTRLEHKRAHMAMN